MRIMRRFLGTEARQLQKLTGVFDISRQGAQSGHQEATHRPGQPSTPQYESPSPLAGTPAVTKHTLGPLLQDDPDAGGLWSVLMLAGWMGRAGQRRFMPRATHTSSCVLCPQQIQQMTETPPTGWRRPLFEAGTCSYLGESLAAPRTLLRMDTRARGREGLPATGCQSGVCPHGAVAFPMLSCPFSLYSWWA